MSTFAPPDHGPVRIPRYVTVSLAFLPLAIAVLDLAGGAGALQAVFGAAVTWPAMSPWVATLVACLAMALLLQVPDPTPVAAKTFARLLCLAVALASSAMLVEFLLAGTTLPGAAWWSASIFATNTPASPQGAVTLLLLAGLIGVLRVDGPEAARLQFLLALLVVVVPSLTLMAYLFQASRLIHFASRTGMAFLTAVACLSLSAAATAVRGDRLPLSWYLASDYRAVVRRVVLAVTGQLFVIWGVLTLLSMFGATDRGALVMALALGLLFIAIVLIRGSLRQLVDLRLRLAAQARAARSDSLYRLLSEHGSDVIGSGPLTGEMDWVSPSVRRTLGWTPEQLVGHMLQDYVHPDDRGQVEQALAEVRAGRRAAYECRVRTNLATYRWMSARVSPVAGPEGDIVGRIIAWRDIDAEHAARERLASAERQYRLLAENATDVVCHVRDDIVVWVSPSVADSWGSRSDRWVGRSLRARVHPEDAHEYDTALAALDGDATAVWRVRMRIDITEYHWVEVHSRRFRGDQDAVDGIIASMRIVDEEVHAAAELDRMARFDALTGLLTRREAIRRLQPTDAQRHPGRGIAVLFCDIDHFKAINDTYGHAAGDAVLRVLAERVRTVVRVDDIVARMGGDELLVMLGSIHRIEEARAVAEKIRVAALEPIPYADGVVMTSISIGVTLAAIGEGADELLARADAAMYGAKAAGRNCVTAFG